MAWRRTFITVCAAQALAMLAFGMALPFLPLYVQRLGIADTHEAVRWAGAMSSGSGLVMAVMAPIWGTLADRYGRKSMVTRALIGGGLIVALMGLAQNPAQLAALRIAQGGFSGTLSATRTLVASVAPATELGFALGMMQTMAYVGNSAGPLLGGILADRVGYGPSFAVTGVLLIGGGIAVLLLVHEDFTRPTPAQAPSPGSAGMQGALRVLWDVPGLAALVATLFFVQSGMSAMGPILPLFVQTLVPPDHGALGSLVGLLYGVSAISSALAAGVAGRVGDRIGHERVLAGCAIGAGLLYLPQALVTNPWQLLGLRACLGLFTGGLMPGVMATIALRTPAARRGWVFGLTATATSLGNAVGPVAGAAAVTAFGLRASFVWTAAVLTLAGLWVVRSLDLLTLARPQRPGQAAGVASTPVEEDATV